MQNDSHGTRDTEEYWACKVKIENLFDDILSNAEELVDCLNKLKTLSATQPGSKNDIALIEKKLSILRTVLRAVSESEPIDEQQGSIPNRLLPLESFNQQFPGAKVEFKNSYMLLNSIFDGGLAPGTLLEFYSNSIAGLDSCLTCGLVVMENYLRSDVIDEKNVRFVTADPVRHCTLFQRFSSVLCDDTYADCIKVAPIDMAEDARATIDDPSCSLDIPQNGLVIINCIDNIIELLGYDSTARRDALKHELFRSLKRAAALKRAIIIITSLIVNKPHQVDKEDCDILAGIEQMSESCIKIRVMNRGQAFLIKRNGNYFASQDIVEFATPDHQENE
nr:hypothetical protein [Candidatus Sigynarchaeota archaeon]